MAVKFFPSKYPTHFAIAAALALRDVVRNPDDIVRMHIDTPEDGTDADRPQPRSGLEGKFSFQYTDRCGVARWPRRYRKLHR